MKKTCAAKTDIISRLLNMAVKLSAFLTMFVLLSIILYILTRGTAYITPSLFSWEYTSKNLSMFPAMINTFFMVAICLFLSVPVGAFSAIYLVEYAKKSNRLLGIIRITSETLSGIPSIVYGLFGYLMFNIWLGYGYSLLSGAFTMAIMILPLIMRTTEESLKSVPDGFREASFGLGASRLRTVFKIVLPCALPGIFSGIILSIGRIVGETAALIFTAGTFPEIATSLFSSSRTLSVHMYALLSEGLYMNEAYAVSVVLLVVVLMLNGLSALIQHRLEKR